MHWPCAFGNLDMIGKFSYISSLWDIIIQVSTKIKIKYKCQASKFALVHYLDVLFKEPPVIRF